jgi:DNA-binding response OmpR family regulator
METRATILLVEDHGPTRKFLADNLVVDGYELLEAECASDARRLLGSKFPDLAIIDLGLPDRDGLELLVTVRGADRVARGIDPALPLLVLSGRASELDRLRGFERGCDDYVTKPFSYPELRARIEVLLRRASRRPSAARTRVGPLELDVLARQVWLYGEPISLSKKEFALLRALVVEPTRVFTREELLRGVWGYRSLGQTRTIDSHACRLRKKLNAAGDRFVVNVWGVGYRLVDGELES